MKWSWMHRAEDCKVSSNISTTFTHHFINLSQLIYNFYLHYNTKPTTIALPCRTLHTKPEDGSSHLWRQLPAVLDKELSDAASCPRQLGQSRLYLPVQELDSFCEHCSLFRRQRRYYPVSKKTQNRHILYLLTATRGVSVAHMKKILQCVLLCTIQFPPSLTTRHCWQHVVSATEMSYVHGRACILLLWPTHVERSAFNPPWHCWPHTFQKTSQNTLL